PCSISLHPRYRLLFSSPLSLPHPPSTLSPYPTLFRSPRPKRLITIECTPTTCSRPRGRIPPRPGCSSRPASRGEQPGRGGIRPRDRKSTRLNSSHGSISYAVFCLKKKKEDR